MLWRQSRGGVPAVAQAEADALGRELLGAYEKDGPKGYWRVQLKYFGSPFWLARVYAQIHAQTGDKQDKENALRCLQTACDTREWWLTFYVMTDWTLDPLRSDPQFDRILKTMKLK